MLSKYLNTCFSCCFLLILPIVSHSQTHCGSMSPIDFSPTQLSAYPRNDITIPVVFHILWHDIEENLPDELIFSQIQVLNDDFNGNNVDIINVPKEFQRDVGNVNISFCLAQEDPEGHPSNGINRIYSSTPAIGGIIGTESRKSHIKHSDLGGVDAWDTDRYLNVWVSARTDEIIGKATFPNDPEVPEGEDGIELDFKVVGSRPDSDYPFNLGRTLTHEIGHYLNLDHLWGKTISCFNEGDMVDDTPRQGEAYFGCVMGSKSSCGSRDMVHNFMNFLDDECMWYFTQGQTDRMIDALFRYRYELISSGICSDATPIPPAPLEVALIRQTPFGVQINLSFLPEINYTLRLYDIQGRHIWTERQNALSVHLIDSKSYQSGVYILTMEYEGQSTAQKIYIHANE